MQNRPAIMLLDSAMGSELERRGCDTSLPLWSARALLEGPDVVGAVHRECLSAGAEAITTNTFRTHQRSLRRANMAENAEELTTLAVQLARDARDHVKPDALVFGSVAPLEDCYQPDLAPPYQTCLIEHREMIQSLTQAGVDRLLIETIGTMREARAASQAAREHAVPWMISLCTDAKGAPGRLLSGESLDDLLPELSDTAAIGFNCVPADAMLDHINWLRSRLPDTQQIIAYANVGRPDPDQGWINTDAVDPERYADHAMNWLEAGATIIGGCCGTTPATIQALHRRLDDHP